MSNTQPIRLHLLGPFAISSDQSVPSLRRKTRALLAYLAVTGQAQPRRTLMDLFCREANAPARTLAVILSRIRKQLGADTLITDGSTVRLNFDWVWVDVAAFQAALGGADMAAQPIEQIETAVSLYRADLLDDLTLNDAPEFELWLLGRRAQMRHLRERGLMALIQRQIDCGQFDAALLTAQQLVQHNPLLEDAHAQLIRLYARTGQRRAALQQYAQCRTLLQQELAIEPGEALQTLAASLEAERPFPPHITPQTAVSFPLSPTASDFVGRTAELTALQTAWQQAQAGQGGVIMIAAQAGGGKTRLVQELCRHLPETPALSAAETAVLTGRCYESTHALPYEPWLPLLEQHLHRLDDAALRQLPPLTQTCMARLLPEVARRQPHLRTVETTGTLIEAEQLFTAVVDFLTQTPDAQPQPTLLFLDDLQWADDASLRLFHYMTHRVQRFPWLLVGAFRTEEAAHTPALTLMLDDLARRNLARLTLTPLTVDDVTTLTAHLWPQLAPGYRTHVADMLAQATGGNALFVTAVLQELAVSDSVPGELPVPATVRDLVQHRLRRLPSGSRQVLEALAIFGTAATLMQLQHISGRGIDEVAQAVELGLQWGLVAADTPATRDAETAVAPTNYQFHHDLVREAVIKTLSAVRTTRLHYRSAVWLARIAERRPTAVQEEMAGRILIHAVRGEAYDLVFQWATAAAAHAHHIFAYRDALDMLERGIDAFAHCQSDPDFDVAAGEKAMFEMIAWWLTYAMPVGKPEAAIPKMVQQAAKIMARHPSPARTARMHWMQAQTAVNYHSAIRSAQTAHEQFLQLNQPLLAASALVTAAAAHLSLSENKNSRRVFTQALHLYRQVDDVPGEVQCLTGLGWVALNLGEVAAALQHLEQSLAISRRRGDRIGEGQTLFVLAAAWGFYHAPEQMEAAATASAQLYEEIGFAARVIRPLLYLGAAQDVRGNLPQALQLYEQVLEQALALKDEWAAGWAAQLAGRIYLQQGAFKTASTLLHQAQQNRIASEERQNQVSDLAWLGRLALAQGDIAAALQHTAQAIARLDAFHGEFYVWEQPDVFMCRAEALAAAGDSGVAADMVRRAYATLHQFAAQISDPVLRTQFFAYRRNVAVETAIASCRCFPGNNYGK